MMVGISRDLAGNWLEAANEDYGGRAWHTGGVLVRMRVGMEGVMGAGLWDAFSRRWAIGRLMPGARGPSIRPGLDSV